MRVKIFLFRLKKQLKNLYFFGSSTLRRRILLINLTALMVPIIGIMWANTYRQSLVHSELNALEIEAELFAAALAEGSLRPSSNNWTKFDIPASQYLLRRMVGSSGVQARLWNYDGKALLDSRVTSIPQIIKTNKLTNLGLFSHIWNKMTLWYRKQIQKLAWSFFQLSSLPVAINVTPPYQLSDFPEVKSSLLGESSTLTSRSFNSQQTLLLSAAVPIQRYKRIYGSIQLIRGSETIDAALFTLYNRIVIIVFFALTVTTILSFWLASTIAQPIYKLTRAANYIRANKDRKGEIPNLSHRKDEIGQLSVNLREMTAALWQRMDAIEAFAADVSHELKNPLTSLKSAVETLQLAKKPEQIQKLKDIINQDIIRLNRLITDISDASRLDAELSRSTLSVVDLKKLTDNLYKAINEQYSDIQFHFDDQTQKKSPLISAHEGRVTQVIHNLLTNAISFAPHGSKITLKLSQIDQSICLEIIDEGPGIPEYALDKIFQRFYTERPKSEGFGNHSGLGLAISRQIAETYDGSLTAHNRSDGKTGAIFRLTLPITKSHTAK